MELVRRAGSVQAQRRALAGCEAGPRVRVTAVTEGPVEARRLGLVEAERAVALVQQLVGARLDSVTNWWPSPSSPTASAPHGTLTLSMYSFSSTWWRRSCQHRTAASYSGPQSRSSAPIRA